MKLFYIDQKGELDFFEKWDDKQLPIESDDDVILLNIYTFNIKIWGKIKVAAMRKVDAKFLAKLIEKGVTGERFNISIR